jgi:hypothetical protein
VAPTAHGGEACARDVDCFGGACLERGVCAATVKQVMCAGFDPGGAPVAEASP